MLEPSNSNYRRNIETNYPPYIIPILYHFDSPSILDDSSGYNNTLYGNSNISTTIKKFGTSSLLCNGGNYSYSNSSSNLYLGSEDFTIDFWIYVTQPSGTFPDYGHASVLSLNNVNGTTDSGDRTSTVISLITGLGWCTVVFASWNQSGGNNPDSSYLRIDSQAGFSFNSWTHVAISKYGNIFYIFINGNPSNYTIKQYGSYINYGGIVLSGTTIGPFTQVINQNYLRIRSTPLYFPPTDNQGIHGGFIGYIDEVRITKGIATWTSNFTPPTSPY